MVPWLVSTRVHDERRRLRLWYTCRFDRRQTITPNSEKRSSPPKLAARGLWLTAHLIMGGRRQQFVQERHGLPGEALPRRAVRHREVQALHVKASGCQARQLRRDRLQRRPRRFNGTHSGNDLRSAVQRSNSVGQTGTPFSSVYTFSTAYAFPNSYVFPLHVV